MQYEGGISQKTRTLYLVKKNLKHLHKMCPEIIILFPQTYDYKRDHLIDVKQKHISYEKEMTNKCLLCILTKNS